jgi:Cu/Ag efflux pump CusA
LAKIFPVMIAAMLIVIMLQVRSLSTMTMVMLTAPLGLPGGSDIAGLQPALRLQRHPRPDRTWPVS